MTALKQNNFKVHFTELLYQATEKILPPNCEIFIELARPKQVEHGDYSSNIALQLARFLHKSPKEIAQSLLQFLPDSPFFRKSRSCRQWFYQFISQTIRKTTIFITSIAARRSFWRY